MLVYFHINGCNTTHLPSFDVPNFTQAAE